MKEILGLYSTIPAMQRGDVFVGAGSNRATKRMNAGRLRHARGVWRVMKDAIEHFGDKKARELLMEVAEKAAKSIRSSIITMHRRILIDAVRSIHRAKTGRYPWMPPRLAAEIILHAKATA